MGSRMDYLLAYRILPGIVVNNKAHNIGGGIQLTDPSRHSYEMIALVLSSRTI